MACTLYPDIIADGGEKRLKLEAYTFLKKNDTTEKYENTKQYNLSTWTSLMQLFVTLSRVNDYS